MSQLTSSVTYLKDSTVTSSRTKSRERGAASVGYTLMATVVMVLSMAGVVELGTRVASLLKNLDGALLGLEFQLIDTGGGSVTRQADVKVIKNDDRTNNKKRSHRAL